eukprot:271590_1
MHQLKQYALGIDIGTLTDGYIRQIVQPLLTTSNIPNELAHLIAEYNQQLANPTLFIRSNPYSYRYENIHKPKHIFIKNVYKSGDNLVIQTDTNQLLVYQSRKETFSRHPFFKDKSITFASNSYHSRHLIIGTTDAVYAYGKNNRYQLGIGEFSVYEKEPTQIVNNTNLVIVDACCGDQYTIFLTQCGHVLSVGWNRDGQCGHPIQILYDDDDASQNMQEITLIKGLKNIIRIACGKQHTLCLNKYGNVYSFGNNSSGQCGHHFNDWLVQNPTMITSINTIVIEDIKCGTHHSCMLDDNGRVYVFGNIGKTTIASGPHLLQRFVDGNITIRSMDCGASYCMFLSRNNEVFIHPQSLNTEHTSDMYGGKMIRNVVATCNSMYLHLDCDNSYTIPYINEFQNFQFIE